MKNQPAVFTWDQLNQFMVNTGKEEFNYDSFKLTYDQDPVIQALVHKFNQNGVELSTKNTKTDTAPSDADPDRSSVNRAAKRATSKAMG